ncbi:MAG: hypothetical protein DIZ80_12625 [endosymbiont of Galathealinum brachiosum]|uniref:Response regulatory domain-containing protein n=1 Tax=endosymbiont of Galathealinum brachiosum TaxID=2200906 RepID=A0A370DDV9_9GAMM|nr:MAG: hypothetical protein DIZ80_12625 [endosymbiont of Galathealinum brachiosum]
MKLKIAVIDDEIDIRDIVRTVLEKEGYDIVEAENGISGLELIRKSAPDLIVCDITMPEMTGDELFKVLRESESDLAVIPFVFLSGSVDTEDKIKRLNNGADGCFKKPVNLSLLVAHINSHLSRVARVSEFFKKNLDDIAEALPNSINHDFSTYKSLTVNTLGYISVLVSAINVDREKNQDEQMTVKKLTTENSDVVVDNFSRLLVKDVVQSEIDYIHYCLNGFKERRKLVRSANGEDLSWTMIFMVVEAELEGFKLFVSDLYVSVPCAKSTINARISSLIEDDVLIKSCDLSDGRRQQLMLTERFRDELMNHIKANIEMVKQVG